MTTRLNQFGGWRRGGAGLLLAAALFGVPAAAQGLPAPLPQVQLAPQVAQARFAVLIPEVILRRPVPDPAAETEIMRALIGTGYRVVDPGTQKRNAERNLLRGQDLSALPDLKSRLDADYLVTGEAFAEEYGRVAGDLRGYTARLEVKVIDLASGQVVFSEAFQGSGVSTTDAVAGKTALMNVGRQAGQKLPALLNQVLQGQTAVAQRAYMVRILTPASFTQVRALSTRLKAAGAREVMVRSVDAGGALLEVVADGDASDVATLLESQGLSVTGLTGNEISVRY
ncbi:hypothetical protein [Deinococcus wulumuqiensis]|uniref:hypothetical protein n=1 Tax=Deinococcus wulumuqiensis TaxID=980427 RepID=UPI001268D55F|nr:hypothetical protein [Deinococcus wulumuqiensis]QII21142.1 hypothetical protein G6R31_10595 [Deinococcus wulumuqiensis R12]